MSRGSKQFRSLVTCDHSLLKPFQRALARYGLELAATGSVRHAGWRVFQPSTGQSFPTAFDQDVQRIIDHFAEGKPGGDLHDVYHPGDAGKHNRVLGDGHGPQVETRANNADFRCMVCGCPGGLPCPSMVASGTGRGFSWAKNLEQKDWERKHIHPGRCRARLRAFIDTPAAQALPTNVVGKKRVEA